jgi:type I restriction enzyme, S subunit
MEVRPGYKQTEAGVFPEDWSTESFGKLFAFSNGVNADKHAYGQGLRFVNVLEPITYSHLYGPEIPGRVSLPDSVAAAYTVKNGDVLFNRTSETDADLGLAATYLGAENVVFGGFVIRGRPTDERLDPTYSGYALRAPAIRSQIIRMGQGAIRSNIGQQNLKLVIAPIPPKAEQRAIATALSDVDALLGGLDRRISKKRDLKQAAMQQLLTGKTRLPGFAKNHALKTTVAGMIPKDWDLVKTGELASITTGARNTQDRVDDGEYPFFVRSATVERINSYSFDGEAVLTAGDGVGTGKIFHYINGKFDFHQRVYRISDFASRLDGYYFFLHFSSRFYDRIMSMTAKSSVDSVRMEMIADMLVPLPTMEEQQAIALVLRDMDGEITALQARREKTSALRLAMMQELLTGKARLVSTGAAHV